MILLTRGDLAGEVRHLLVVRVGEALCASPLVRGTIGATRAGLVAREACARAGLALTDRLSEGDHAGLVEHLRLRGELTETFVMRAVALGKIDFFAATLAALAGEPPGRVRSLLAGGREAGLTALFRSAGLGASCHAVIVHALRMWREIAGGGRAAA